MRVIVQRRGFRWALAVLQVVITVTLLGVLLQSVDVAEVWHLQGRFSLAVLLAGTGFFVLSFVINTYNWFYLLSELVPEASYRRMISANLSGLFYGTVLPSAISSDLARGIRLYETDRQARAVTVSIVADRLTGLAVFVLILLASSAPYYDLMPEDIRAFLAEYRALVLVAGMVGALVAGVVLRSRLHWLQFTPRRLLAALGITTVSHVCYAAMLWVLCLPFVEQPDFLYCLFITEVAVLAEFLPISVGGLGVREGIYLVMLAELGIAAPEAVAISLMQFALILLVSLGGGLQEVIRATAPVRPS